MESEKVLDAVVNLLGNGTRTLPTGRLLHLVGGDKFKEVGEEFLTYFVELADLKPDERVLDIGCGIGRQAFSLAKYLNQKGSYEGLDVVPIGIHWCKKNIAARYPNFNFQLIDVLNNFYNPSGKCRASRYKFPFPNSSFDFTYFVSVFTHLLPEDMENYFREAARLLKKGGRFFATFFLCNTPPHRKSGGESQALNFKYVLGRHQVVDIEKPEYAVAYDEEYILNLFERNGLEIKPPLHYGSWNGRAEYLGFQDIIIAFKP